MARGLGCCIGALHNERSSDLPQGATAMAKPISQFFADLGFPLRNIRWSWGARSGVVVLLRTWQDEYVSRERKVTVLREPAGLQETDSFGLDERIVQLKSLWEGEVAGYTVIVEVKDRAARPREIKDYREDVVFAIKRLVARPDGSIAAELSDMVPVASLNTHAQTHRTEQGEGIFPVDEAQRSGLSTETYQQKLPAIRAWLIEVCQNLGKVSYSDVMNRFGLTFYPLRNAMSRLGHDCRNAGEPIITAVIVDKETGRCSEGLQAEFGVVDDEAERQRCYGLWGGGSAAPSTVSAAAAAALPTPNPTGAPSAAAEALSEVEAVAADDLEQRAARFAQVEVRRQQASFRNAVFRACGGLCVVSSCSVPEALEAAHLSGRDWRTGHNSAEDGVLLRRDLHTLYDRGLLTISSVGHVALDPRVRDYYGEFDGGKARG